jgi:hypothetical protein
MSRDKSLYFQSACPPILLVPAEEMYYENIRPLISDPLVGIVWRDLKCWLTIGEETDHGRGEK